jgi:two-component system nitrogen regulation response regulator GlnG
MTQILIVDDEASICWALEQIFQAEGYHATTCSNAEEGLSLAKRQKFDVVMMDIRLPGMDGITAMQSLYEISADTPIVIMTAFGDLPTTVKAIHKGAFEFLAKPFDMDDALGVIQRALDQIAQSQSAFKNDAAASVTGNSISGQLLGNSPAMQKVFRRIALVADKDVPVLICGESGSGKELVAQAIHRYSLRASEPFIPVCVPAMSESVLESELFGHTKGAYTGAQVDRQGLLAHASLGTAFFDEIGDISLATQIKLLRVIETRTVIPVGSNTAVDANFRLIAATHRHLEEMIVEGSFREDLYYRLNVFRIYIPPLRERREDIPLLAEHFLKLIDDAQRLKLSPEFLAELEHRPWFGNVRELKHAIEHAAIVTRTGVLRVETLPPPLPAKGSMFTSSRTLQESVLNWVQQQLQDETSDETMKIYDHMLEEIEPVVLSEVLKKTSGNRKEAAEILGMHRQTLRDKLRKHHLDAE